jgi:hypothetical protein
MSLRTRALPRADMSRHATGGLLLGGALQLWRAARSVPTPLPEAAGASVTFMAVALKLR